VRSVRYNTALEAKMDRFAILDLNAFSPWLLLVAILVLIAFALMVKLIVVR
jgi:hypothetical protein